MTGAGVATEAAPVPTSVPARADGLQLLGEMEASGFREAPCLARRADGQTIQLTELLYRVLEAVDGRRDLEAIAAAVSERTGRDASADDVRFLIEEKLRPLGVLKRPDGSEPDVRKANPLLALRLRYVLSDERTTRRITAPFARLFFPPLVVAVVAGFLVMVGWLLFAEGIGAGTRQALYQPGLLVLVFGLTAASAGFHEFGHAAALRYGGGAPGVMGAGLYLVWPAFYTDVTDSYRLPRRARLRTDLGGLYFNMVFALATVGAWAVTGFDALLLVVPLQLLQMVQQLLPFVRLDGYHILADLTGVPDLFSRIKPTLASLKPGSDPDSRVTALKPWVRVVVSTWVLLVVPLLLLALLFAVFTLPRVAATAWDSLGRQRELVAAAAGDGDPLGALGGVLSILALCLPLLSTLYLLSRLVTRVGKGAWARTGGRPAARLALGLVAVALAAGLAFLWWPNGEYQPIQPGERGRIQETISSVRRLPAGRPTLPTDEPPPPGDGAVEEGTAPPATVVPTGGEPVGDGQTTPTSTAGAATGSTPTTAVAASGTTTPRSASTTSTVPASTTTSTTQTPTSTSTPTTTTTTATTTAAGPSTTSPSTTTTEPIQP